MSLLSDLTAALSVLEIPMETGVFRDTAPDEYVVVTPLNDLFIFADDVPYTEVQQARLSLFTKSNYMSMKNRIVRQLLDTDFTITERRYLGREDATGYHHYSVDIEKEYTV